MLTVKNKADVAEIYISGDIVDDNEGNWIASWNEGNTTGYEFPTKLREQLNGIGKETPLEIHINSHGGSVFAGVAMANFIANHKGKTTCIVDGIAASIASQIFFSADVCKMPENAWVMIHCPFTYVEGNADELRKAAEVLDTLQEGLETTYRKKAREGVSDEEIHAMMNAETWMTGTQAAEKFKVKLLNPVPTLNAIGNIEKLKARGIKKIPDALSIYLDKSKVKPPIDDKNNEIIRNALERSKGMMSIC